ncbi:hypothetical protein E4U37_001547 [Claviceps purpurea]|nr:hypothetical protein E4U37_001547 [Claviceps purpurea]
MEVVECLWFVMHSFNYLSTHEPDGMLNIVIRGNDSFTEAHGVMNIKRFGTTA